jgi:segregation and condensation protein A
VIAATGQPLPVMITFAAARRAEDATRVRLDVFDGPLAVLLSLIEQRQLDVLTVRLGDLAPAFLDALAGLETGRLPLLSAFVGVSAQLILIKSRATATPARRRPSAERKSPTRPTPRKNYAAGCCRLAISRRRCPPGGHCRCGQVAVPSRRKRHSPRAAMPGRRSCPLSRAPAGRRPAHVGTPRRATEHRPTVRCPCRDRAARRPIRRALRSAPRIVLQELLHNVQDRVVVAVTFMALLEMVKGREIAIEQQEPWGPISVSAINDR